MRASRLLRMLLILQNRGRQSGSQLAQDLEVSTRTIYRDVDALAEAGLPVVVHQGKQGGIELAFNYRTRLTGLDADEAEALALLLARPARELGHLGIGDALRRVRAKVRESLPDQVRAKVKVAEERFRYADAEDVAEQPDDPRIAALALAVRERRIVRIHARSKTPFVIHPRSLEYDGSGWRVVDAKSDGTSMAVDDCGDINISARRFS